MSLRRTCMNLLRAAALGGAALVGAGMSATAEQIDLIVDRGVRGVEIFLGMPASTAVTRFGLDPDDLTGPDGTIDFTAFTVGTWDIGDALLDGVEIRIGTEAAGFEATSLMVHLKDQRLPFKTPLDGLTAISVCGVLPPETPPALDDLYLYAGFVAYPQDTGADLRFDLPEEPGDGLSVTVREYGAGHTGQPQVVRVAPGEALVIGARRGWVSWGIAGVLAVLTVIAVARGLRPT